MKKLLFPLMLLAGVNGYAQQSEINFPHQYINFSAAPRTSINPMSLKMWDNYGSPGGPSTYGTVFEFYGQHGHQTGQLYFGGWDSSKIRYREAFYAENNWSNWITLLDSKNNLESNGNLMINGSGNHFISNGNVGIGILEPDAKMQIIASGLTPFKATGTNGYVIIDNVSSGENYYAANNSHHFQVNGSDKLLINTAGDVGIGTATPKEKLSVNGKIRAHEVKVETANWPDYVFEEGYKPKSLQEIEEFIKLNKHLPEVPSANEVTQNGIELGEMNKILLKKIEELTLYLIAKDKKVEQQDLAIKNLSMQMQELQNLIKSGRK